MRRYAAVVSVIMLLSMLPFASAGWFSDAWHKITGKVTDTGETFSSDEEIQASGSDAITINANIKEVEKKSCCFCGYDGEHADAWRFLKECDLFFQGKANPEDSSFKCDVKEKVKLSEWESRISELQKQYICAQPLHIYHAQHGPICARIAQVIKVCASEFPGCDLDFASVSCESFRDLDEVEKHFKEIQEVLKTNVTITACGNRLDGIFGEPACTLTSIVKITKDSFSVKPGLCKKEGEECSPANGIAYDCSNSAGKKTTQRCCHRATSLQAYSFNQDALGKFSQEGAASCPDLPCAEENEKCFTPGETYSCVTPDGLMAKQPCCAQDAKMVRDKAAFGAINSECVLPKCISADAKAKPISCETPGMRILCMDDKGEESFQYCCGTVKKEGGELSLFSSSFLSSPQQTCVCPQSPPFKTTCLINGRNAEENSAYCIYDSAQEGTPFCGTLKNGVCDKNGRCVEGKLPCKKDVDCYKKGNKYCSVFGEENVLESVARQRCDRDQCVMISTSCKQGEQCKETATGASCIRQGTKNKIASFWDNVFRNDEIT